MRIFSRIFAAAIGASLCYIAQTQVIYAEDSRIINQSASSSLGESLANIYNYMKRQGCEILEIQLGRDLLVAGPKFTYTDKENGRVKELWEINYLKNPLIGQKKRYYLQDDNRILRVMGTTAHHSEPLPSYDEINRIVGISAKTFNKSNCRK